MWFSLLLVFCITLAYYVIRHYSYWKNRNITQGPIVPIFGDSLRTVFRKECLYQMNLRVYQRFPNERYTGIYQMSIPILVIRDPDLLKLVSVKDFDHFTDHRDFLSEESDPLWSKTLFSLKGEKWREMRATVSPAFTSSKMRSMFYLINECAEGLADYFEKEIEKGHVVHELRDVFTRFANDVIATCAFGIKCDSLKEPENEFFVMGRKATDFNNLWTSLKIFAYCFVPSITKVLDLKMFSKESADFFTSVISSNLRIREKKGIVRPDLIHLFMEARKGNLKHDMVLQKQDCFATVEESEIGKNEKKMKRDISDLDVTAQALIFIFAGFESVATLMSFMSYELAVNPGIQKRMQEEIDEAREKCNGKFTYETLAEMKYMDMVISETLRKWPPVVTMERSCVKPYTIPATRPNESDVHLKVGDMIWLPAVAIHRDPQYFADPEIFDPERFNDENKHKIKPYTYNPFGFGPRNCIGSRFAIMETKTIFYYLLSKFDLEVVEQTVLPVKVNKKVFNLGAESVILGFKARQRKK